MAVENTNEITVRVKDDLNSNLQRQLLCKKSRA